MDEHFSEFAGMLVFVQSQKKQKTEILLRIRSVLKKFDLLWVVFVNVNTWNYNVKQDSKRNHACEVPPQPRNTPFKHSAAKNKQNKNSQKVGVLKFAIQV